MRDEEDIEGLQDKSKKMEPRFPCYRNHICQFFGVHRKPVLHYKCFLVLFEFHVVAAAFFTRNPIFTYYLHHIPTMSNTNLFQVYEVLQHDKREQLLHPLTRQSFLRPENIPLGDGVEKNQEDETKLSMLLHCVITISSSLVA
uniref:Uncharacterized protein n=1 Tax=Salix viminalis TaxID=40686 RepID=A0A6N2KK91_SALVM